MTLRIGDMAPDFLADTTTGRIRFHDWIADGWAFFFSHPADFTPVCTTEMGRTAHLSPAFTKRGVKPIGLSTDKVEEHVIPPSVCDADAKVAFPQGFETLRPYLRKVAL